jgi:hypothetical protein
VTLARRGEQVVGTLHLTPHHIIFSHISQGAETAQAQGTPVRPRELWITYPIISFCTCRPTPAASRQLSSIRLRCRDFTFICFYFASESKARDVYESIKLWTCKVGRIDKLYAFTYQPPPPEREFNGWELYDARKEWARQGVGCDGNDNGWRISEINTDYGVNLSLTSSSMIGVLTLDISVFTDVPRSSTGAVVHFRQYAQLCGSLSVESTRTCPNVSPSRQQLLNHEKLSAFGRCTAEPKHPG